jgi:RNA polymerase sigma-70 factor, ECF subfamily
VDEGTFAELIERHDRSLRSLAFRLLADRDRMDDVLQDAYVKAFRALPRFRSASAPSTWLYRIFYNTCRDELRRDRRRRQLPLEALETAVETDPANAAAGRAGLAAALGALPADQRVAVLLVDADGFDYRAAAEVLGIEVGTLASRLSRARAALRRTLLPIPEGAENG